MFNIAISQQINYNRIFLPITRDTDDDLYELQQQGNFANDEELLLQAHAIVETAQAAPTDGQAMTVEGTTEDNTLIASILQEIENAPSEDLDDDTLDAQHIEKVLRDRMESMKENTSITYTTYFYGSNKGKRKYNYLPWAVSLVCTSIVKVYTYQLILSIVHVKNINVAGMYTKYYLDI